MSQDPHLQLFLEHRRELVNYASSLLSSPDSAEDLVQEAWLRFKRHSLEEVRHPAGYLFRMVRNLALDQLRGQQAESRWVSPFTEETHDLGCEENDPLIAVSRSSTVARLQQVLDQLPEEVRHAFEMHRFGGYTMQQIARHLDMSVSSVHRAIHQALRSCLEQVKDES